MTSIEAIKAKTAIILAIASQNNESIKTERNSHPFTARLCLYIPYLMNGVISYVRQRD